MATQFENIKILQNIKNMKEIPLEVKINYNLKNYNNISYR